MSKTRQKQSSPYATAPGGGIFETRVQAAFAALMLTGRIAPCLLPWPIVKIQLQGSYAEYNTDDFIVVVEDVGTRTQAKILAQIKHIVNITEKDAIFNKVIVDAWNDFNDPSIFNKNQDIFALITGPLNATDTNNVRTILGWARHSENATEFFTKINKDHFSSEVKKTKLNAFRTQLQNANGGTCLSENQLWEFLKHFHLIGYDLDSDDGVTESLILTLISQFSDEDPLSLWTKLVSEIQSFAPDAGTVSLKTISHEIRNSFKTRKKSSILTDLKKIEEHSTRIIEGIRTDIGGASVARPELLSQLIEESENSKFVFLSGERGCGKSSLIREFAEHIEKNARYICFRTEDLDHSHLDKILAAIGITSTLSDLEAEFALTPKKYLFIESLEKLLELQNISGFTDLVRFVQSQPGWTIIASGRNYAYQQISFNYLDPSEIEHKLLIVTEFTDEEVNTLCEKLEELKPLTDNPILKKLIRNPFIAGLAFRVARNGKQFSSDDGEREFRAAVWSNVILKESDRTDGMPIRRQRTFIDVAVKRAKQMVYEVSESEFDPNAILKLESDSLIYRNPTTSCVRPDHDVLEDWALVRYIEEKYLSSMGKYDVLLSTIGHEPAMNRAFRLWLNQELKDGKNLKDFIKLILISKDIEKIWQDETITAILQSKDPSVFLFDFKDQLFENDGELLKRFCLVLRVSCKLPDYNLLKQISEKEGKKETFIHTLYLTPYGEGWNSLIHFVFCERSRLSYNLLPHISSVLEDWSLSVHFNEKLPPISRDVGLLTLELLTPLKDSYNDKDKVTKILEVLFRVVSSVQNEFNKMLDDDLFSLKGKKRRLRYLDVLVKISLTGSSTKFLCKSVPETVTKIAYNEWLITKKRNEDDRHSFRDDVDECFGLHNVSHGWDYFPATGIKGPFQYLLRYHPKLGLDFIIDLLNHSAENYAHSNLDKSEIFQIEIKLSDGTRITQYCSERLWLGYRGQSVIPYVLQCALMALENELIFLCKYEKLYDTLQMIFTIIISRSNSVMPTAMLASIATGFPKIFGASALPLLNIPIFYDLDLKRRVQERGKKEDNWFKGIPDSNSPYHMEERYKSATQKWRNNDLEFLLIQLQATPLRERILPILDNLKTTTPDNETWKFRLHRMDTRNWEPKIDEENHCVVITPKELTPELSKIQEKSFGELTQKNRFYALFFWADKVFKNEPLDHEYYATWQDALEETKNLNKLLQSDVEGDISEELSGILLFSSGLIKAAALFIRDHSDELQESDALFCINLILSAVMIHADSTNPVASQDITDSTGASASASILPIVLDYAEDNEDDKKLIKEVLIAAVTHANENVGFSAANGIREYLWQRDADFAQRLVYGSIEYARLKSIEQREYYKKNFDRNWIIQLRERILREDIVPDVGKIDFKTHNPNFLLLPCLMIQKGSTKSDNFTILLKLMVLLGEAEQNKDSHEDDAIQFNYEIPVKFAKMLAEYLFDLTDSAIKQTFVKQLQSSCYTSPSLLYWILLYYQELANQYNSRKRYWDLWSEISEDMQKIAIERSKSKSRVSRFNRSHDSDEQKLIRFMLYADIRPENVDYERDNVTLGQKHICNFVASAGINRDVFEAMTALMYYFPEIFFETGLKILSKKQTEVGGIDLLSPISSFYLERCLNRFLLSNSSPISIEKYQSCQVLLNALVENTSSGAYYLRDYLIRCRRIAV